MSRLKVARLRSNGGRNQTRSGRNRPRRHQSQFRRVNPDFKGSLRPDNVKATNGAIWRRPERPGLSRTQGRRDLVHHRPDQQVNHQIVNRATVPLANSRLDQTVNNRSAGPASNHLAGRGSNRPAKPVNHRLVRGVSHNRAIAGRNTGKTARTGAVRIRGIVRRPVPMAVRPTKDRLNQWVRLRP